MTLVLTRPRPRGDQVTKRHLALTGNIIVRRDGSMPNGTEMERLGTMLFGESGTL